MSIRIRSEQQEALARIPERPFVEEVLARLGAGPPEPHDPPPAEREAWVRARMDWAHAHGITHQRHVWQLVKLARRLGAGFVDEPWAQQIVALALPGGTTINALHHELRQREQATSTDAE